MGKYHDISLYSIRFGGRRFLILWIPSKCLAFYRILNRSQSLWDEVTPSQHLQVSFSSIIAASTGYLMICLLQHEDPTHFFSTLASRKSCESKVKWIQVQSGTHGYSTLFNSLMLFLLYGITRPEMYLVNLHQITWIVAKASYRDLCSTSWMIIPGILWKSWLNYRWPWKIWVISTNIKHSKWRVRSGMNPMTPAAGIVQPGYLRAVDERYSLGKCPSTLRTKSHEQMS